MQLCQIYKVLANQIQANNNQIVKEILENHPAIFIPTAKVKNNNDLVTGKFYHCKEVFCLEETGLFKKYKSEFASLILSKYYSKGFKSEFQEVFSTLGVILYPTLDTYVNLFSDIQKETQSEKISFEEAVQDVYKLFEFFIYQCSNDVVLLSNFVQTIIENKSIWPCVNKKWISLSENPLIIDDSDLSSKFIDKINFLCLPSQPGHTTQNSDYILEKLSTEQSNYEILKSRNPNMNTFLLNICNIKTVTSAIVANVENITANLRPAPSVQNICRKILFYIQCFLAHKIGYADVYNECINAKYDELLPKMKFYSVKSLETYYYCTYDPSINTVITKNSFSSKSETGYLQYFVSADIINDEKELLIGFIDCFVKKEKWLKTELTKFIKLIHPFIKGELSNKDKVEIEKDHGIRLNLDETKEKIWNINEAQEFFKPSVVPPPVDAVDPQSSNSNQEARRKVKYNLNQQRVPGLIDTIDSQIGYNENLNKIFQQPFVSPILEDSNNNENDDKNQIDEKTLEKLYSVTPVSANVECKDLKIESKKSIVHEIVEGHISETIETVL